MDFFAAQEQARKKTRWLVFLFALAVSGIVLLAHLIAMFIRHTFAHPSYMFNFLSLAMVLLVLFLVGLLLVLLWFIFATFCECLAGKEEAPGHLALSFMFLLFPVILLYLFVPNLDKLVDFMDPGEDPGYELINVLLWWDSPFAFFFSLLAGGFVVVASWYKIRQINQQGGTLIAEQLGGRMILRETHDTAERRLLNVMDEMSIAAGIPTPVAYVLAEEQGLNAFAAGLSMQDSVIAVTRGLLDTMDRDELQGVIAHEIGHIVNGDSRLNSKLVGILFGIFVMVLFGRIALKTLSKSSNQRNAGFAYMIAVTMYISGSVGLFFGRLIQSAISRERESLADAAALQFTRNSAGLVSALNKLRLSGSQIQNPQALAASHLFFGASEKSSWFATHPPLEERIQRLGGKAVPLPEKGVDAQTLLARLPDTLRQAAASVADATGIVCGLFFSNQSDVRLQQEKMLPNAARSTAQAVYQWRVEQGARYRLICFDLVLPTLREAPKNECQKLLYLVKKLIHADEQVSASEFALYSILQNTLLSPSRSKAKSGKPPPRREATDKPRPKPLDSDIACLLALIARAGHEDEEKAKAAFQAAMAHSFAQLEITIPDKDELSLDSMAEVLSRLALTAPLHRKKILEACALAVQHDGKITPVENELLRAFTQALDCPAPLV